eukprot:NODE_684_length_4771_cov_0.551156.p3 type:complete len:141 gc:universal NODE_684_length_4771_cov_0.551156:2969-3391(+)
MAELPSTFNDHFIIEYKCEICFEKIELEKRPQNYGIKIFPCCHVLCVECLHKHVEISVGGQYDFPLKCPQECSSELEPDFLFSLNIFDKDLMDKFEKFHLKALNDFLQCSNKSCRHSLMITDEVREQITRNGFTMCSCPI